MQVVAIYPGTFDPLTLGHIDVAKRAARMFDQLILSIAESTSKKPHFTLDERISMAEQIMKEYDNIEVQAFTGLTVDLAKKLNARVIVRGLRAISDFDFEVQIAGMNRHLARDIETVFITASQDYTFLSSSLVREVASHDGDVSEFVHPLVLEALHRKKNG